MKYPYIFRPRRLADWLNPTGARKVHSLIDKVYQWNNLERAWETECEAKSGVVAGWMGRVWRPFGGQLNEQLEQLQQRSLKDDSYQPQHGTAGTNPGRRAAVSLASSGC